MALANEQRVVPKVFACHLPMRIRRAADTADSEALTLSKGVVHQSLVLAKIRALCRADFPGLTGQVRLEEIIEQAFTDKADAGRILFIVGNEAGGCRPSANRFFFQLTNRKQAAFKLLSRNQL